MQYPVTALVVLAVLSGCDKSTEPQQQTSASIVSILQCGKDTDCKGDRVCENGQCIAPGQGAVLIPAVHPNEAAPEPASSADEYGSGAPKFEDYAVSSIYSGPPAQIFDPSLGKDEDLLDVMKKKPAYAGEYVPFDMETTCGTGGVECAPDTGFISIKTGKVLQFDPTNIDLEAFGWRGAEFGWRGAGKIVNYKVDSRLLVTEEMNLDDEGNEVRVATDFYVVENNTLRLVKKIKSIAN